MDWAPRFGGTWDGPSSTGAGKRWVTHEGHLGAVASSPGPHGRRVAPGRGRRVEGPKPEPQPEHEQGRGSFAVTTSATPPTPPSPAPRLVTLDGSHGEGGGQIL